MDAMTAFLFGPTVLGLGLLWLYFSALDSSIFGEGNVVLGLWAATVGLVWIVAFAALKAVTFATVLWAIGVPVGLVIAVALLGGFVLRH